MERQVPDRPATIEQACCIQVKMREIRQAIERAGEAACSGDDAQVRRVGVSQIAKALALFESAVKSLLFRAYETLRARLAHMA